MSKDHQTQLSVGQGELKAFRPFWFQVKPDHFILVFKFSLIWSTFSLDLDKKLLSFDLVIPKLRLDATYNLKGNILLLPIVGSGNVAMSMKDVKSSVYTKISIKKRPEVSGHKFAQLFLWNSLNGFLLSSLFRISFTSKKWRWHSWSVACESI